MRNFRIGLGAAFILAACKMGSNDATDPTTSESSTCTDPSCQPKPCTSTNECAAMGGVCNGSGQCAPASGIDGVKNGDETDIDCGGAQSPKCSEGKACASAANCESNACDGGVCTAPRPDDGIKNGDETDIDCGGTAAPKCGSGRGCLATSDCAAGACSYKNVCVDRPSCAPHFGGDTCGAGETDDVNAQHESCCTSLDLPMPGKTVSLDKYQITAGRYRVFLDAVQGNVRQFVQQHRPVGWDPVWDDFVPNGWDVDPTIQASADPDMMKRNHSAVWHQLGGTALLTKLDHKKQPYRYGCYIQGNGTHTYRMPDDVQVNVLKDIPAKYPQEVLDTKPLNCVTVLMLMAFCEWDWPGSHVPTYEETRWAWHGGDLGGHKYPWGNTPAPVGFLYPGDVFGPTSGVPEPSGQYGEYAVIPPDAAGTPGSPDYANWKYNYTWPPNADQFYPDFSAHISAPGRFPKGNGPFGHADMAGNLFDSTSTIDGAAGQHPDDREVSWGRNGAWEGHNIPFASENGPWTAPIMRKYGKAGGRCAK